MILIIDDEVAIREAVSDILEMVDVPSVSASNGKDGITLFQERQSAVKAILLDMRMPVMSGVETYRALRRLDSDIPIILSSGYDDAENAAAFSGDARVSFLHKPYSMDTLIDLVHQTMSDH